MAGIRRKPVSDRRRADQALAMAEKLAEENAQLQRHLAEKQRAEQLVAKFVRSQEGLGPRLADAKTPDEVRRTMDARIDRLAERTGIGASLAGFPASLRRRIEEANRRARLRSSDAPKADR